jgi:hypothetical protein
VRRRHHIVGSEAHEPRPLAYLRRGRVRRHLPASRQRLARALAVSLLVAVICLALRMAIG